MEAAVVDARESVRAEEEADVGIVGVPPGPAGGSGLVDGRRASARAASRVAKEMMFVSRKPPLPQEGLEHGDSGPGQWAGSGAPTSSGRIASAAATARTRSAERTKPLPEG